MSPECLRDSAASLPEDPNAFGSLHSQGNSEVTEQSRSADCSVTSLLPCECRLPKAFGSSGRDAALSRRHSGDIAAVCLAPKALCHLKPGATPQELSTKRGPALKARFNQVLPAAES